MSRYYVVIAPKSEIAHRAYKHSDGERTFCGRIMSAGWAWAKPPRRLDSRKCMGCYG